MPKRPKGNKLEQETVGKLMVELCLQTTFSIMLFHFYTITDTFFVVRGVGMSAGGAIGIFSPFLILINGISSTLGTGGGSVIARKMGEGDWEKGKKVVGCVMWVWIVSSLLITAAGLMGLKPLLRLLGCTRELYPYAREYGQIMLVGIITSTGFSGIMRAEGDSTFSTFQWCFPVLVNLILDPLFIFLFKWGIVGAAMATLASQVCSMCSSIYYFFFRTRTRCKIKPGQIRFDADIGKEIFSVGIPAFLNHLGSSLVGILGNQIIGNVGGTVAISAYAVVSRIQGFASTPFSGIMQGIQPMLGFDYGGKRRQRMDKTIRYAVRFVVTYGCLAAFCLFLGAEYIFGFFEPADTVADSGIMALRILCWGLAFGGIMPITQAFYQAVGKGKTVLILFLCSILLIRIPLLLLAGATKSLPGLWFTLMIMEWLVAGGAYYFLCGAYTKMDVKRY
ncbi:MATE family efflux transporter [Parablautia muri]|uniref:MATE family efflux transporter n=1 Tax=Parablautia muri TaxID=2320879 RepID=A0A9X5BDX0_9FIRM|nr:MATE family efflux transporter [Parablautia muri]NBJ92040.1 MATE family efflux transporter [Parablautia muri]